MLYMEDEYINSKLRLLPGDRFLVSIPDCLVTSVHERYMNHTWVTVSRVMDYNEDLEGFSHYDDTPSNPKPWYWFQMVAIETKQTFKKAVTSTKKGELPDF